MKEDHMYNKWLIFIDQYGDYFRTNEEQWHIILERVKQYIDKFGCKPSRGSDDDNIKAMGIWIRKQQQNEKNRKQIMQNEEVYQKWIAFIKQYGNLF